MLAKRAQRKLIAEALAALPKSAIETQSERIAGALRALPEYSRAQNIALYLHLDNREVRTDAMMANAFDDGKTVFIPKITPVSEAQRQYPKQETHLSMLECPDQAAIDKLVPQGCYKLREPESGADCLDLGGLDLIVLPGVAFTKTCERLGHGRGYYDTFIAEHLKVLKKRPALIGVGFTEQIVPSLPTEEHDLPLDGVVDGNGAVYRQTY